MLKIVALSIAFAHASSLSQEVRVGPAENTIATPEMLMILAAAEAAH